MENVRNIESNTAAAQECCAPAAKSAWLNPRNLFIGAALAGGAGALVLGWDSLVALGLSSFVLALLPCAAMCALGLCASRMGKRDAGIVAGAVPPKEADPPAAETLASAEASAVEKTKAPAPGAPAS